MSSLLPPVILAAGDEAALGIRADIGNLGGDLFGGDRCSVIIAGGKK